MLNAVLLVLGIVAFEYTTGLALSLARQEYSQDSDPSTRSSEECIDVSLSDPSWDIFNPALVTVNGSSGGTQGDIRFLTVNAATGVNANCTANNIELQPTGLAGLEWHNCSIPDLFFQFDLATLDMRLRGSWRCSNDSSSLSFAANGSWDTPLIQGCLDDTTARGQETLCIMGNSQVSAGLSSPVPINPQLPVLPSIPAELAQRCVDRSYEPEWQINDLFYRHHSAQMPNATRKSYYLLLNVTNISEGETIICSVTVDLLKDPSRNGSTSWVQCEEAGGSRPPSNVSSISVMLDTDYGILGLQQSWNCSDGVAGVERGAFVGIAYTNISLSCSNESHLITHDGRGAVAAVTADSNCSLSTTPITFGGYVDSAPLMPHTYYTPSCTIGSLFNTTAMELLEYQIDAMIPVNRGRDKVSMVGSFTLYNPGPGDVYRLFYLPVIDDGSWHECVAGQEALPWQLVGCKYFWDRSSRRLGFQVQWYCDDRNPSHPILFNATMEQRLPVAACEVVKGRQVTEACELRMPVSSVTWITTNGTMDRGPTLPWISRGQRHVGGS